MVLDEATAHLDSFTEKKMLDNLAKMSCTQLVIAHRLSSVQDADEITVLDTGKVVSRGKHNELIRKCVIYQELYGKVEV